MAQHLRLAHQTGPQLHSVLVCCQLCSAAEAGPSGPLAVAQHSAPATVWLLHCCHLHECCQHCAAAAVMMLPCWGGRGKRALDLHSGHAAAACQHPLQQLNAACYNLCAAGGDAWCRHEADASCCCQASTKPATSTSCSCCIQGHAQAVARRVRLTAAKAFAQGNARQGLCCLPLDLIAESVGAGSVGARHCCLSLLPRRKRPQAQPLCSEGAATCKLCRRREHGQAARQCADQGAAP